MKSISIDELKILAQFQSPALPCVSIYVPTHRHLPGAAQDPIRLKNMLRDTERRLVETGVETAQTREILRPAQDLLADPVFWKHQNEGLAVFIAKSFFRVYRMPIRVPELLVTTYRFHLKPLLALLSRDRRFFILALSQKEARLFEGSLEGVVEITPDEFPRGLSEILDRYEPTQELQSHTGTGGASGRSGSIFHGKGSPTEDLKHRISEYFRLVNASLADALAQQDSPLVLACVDYLLPIYRSVNTYPHLLDAGITGNHDSASADEIHQRALTVVGPLFQKVRLEAEEQHRALAGTGRVSRDLKDIVPAAYHGRVESLFVAVGIHAWGRFAPDSGALEMHREAQPNDEDLLDLTAIRTFLNRGDVFAVQPPEVPGSGTMSAVFRY